MDIGIPQKRLDYSIMCLPHWRIKNKKLFQSETSGRPFAGRDIKKIAAGCNYGFANYFLPSLFRLLMIHRLRFDGGQVWAESGFPILSLSFSE